MNKKLLVQFLIICLCVVMMFIHMVRDEIGREIYCAFWGIVMMQIGIATKQEQDKK